MATAHWRDHRGHKASLAVRGADAGVRHCMERE
jgi:hypothetical protein